MEAEVPLSSHHLITSPFGAARNCKVHLLSLLPQAGGDRSCLAHLRRRGLNSRQTKQLAQGHTGNRWWGGQWGGAGGERGRLSPPLLLPPLPPLGSRRSAQQSFASSLVSTKACEDPEATSQPRGEAAGQISNACLVCRGRGHPLVTFLPSRHWSEAGFLKFDVSYISFCSLYQSGQSLGVTNKPKMILA